MEYYVKKKLINGKMLFGIIDENLNEVLPFKYSNIEKMIRYGSDFSQKEPYFVVCNQDNKKGIFAGGSLILEPFYDYAELIPSSGNSYLIEFIVGRQTEECMQYGILQRQPENENEFKYVMIYPFGKADEIKWEHDKIMLYKTRNNRALKGIFGHPEFGEPKYTQLDYYSLEPHHPLMPDPEAFLKETRARWNFEFYHWDISCAKIGMIKSRREVKGILTGFKNYDKYHSSSNKIVWKEFIPCEYSDCSINPKDQLITLSKIKNGRVFKGLMGYSIYWDIFTTGSIVNGHCTLKPEFTIPCEYDDIKLLCGFESYPQKIQYYCVTKDGKKGLIKSEFSTARGPYDDNIRYNPLAKTEILLECEYDDISILSNTNFVITIDNKKGILIAGMIDKDGNLLKTNCEYKSIESIGHCNFVITDFDGKKGLLICSKVIEKKSNDKNKYSLDLVVSGLDGVEYESNMHKLVTKIGENNIRIRFINDNGDILFDEQGENISVSYCESLRTFLVANNGILQIRYSKKDREHNNTKTNIQGDYTTFDIIGDSKQIKYRKKSDTGDSKYGLYKFKCSSLNDVIVEPLLNDEYESIDTVLNGTRSIVSKVINDDCQALKYGVTENNQGNECIPIEYDSIVLENNGYNNKVFVATNMVNGIPQQFVFDTDGFVIGDNTVSDGSKRLVLTNNSNN